MIQQALKLLQLLSDNQVHSGVELGSQLGISRAGVWKLLRKMQNEFGVEIKAVAGSGYCLAQPISLLDADQIKVLLDRMGSNLKSAQIYVHDSVSSTNDLAMASAAKGSSGISIWLAEHQSSGRGRRGKTWQSPLLGNIYCSVLWRMSGGSRSLEGLSLVAGIAMAEALVEIGVPNVQLKWPNDIWIDGNKLGGILIEISGDPFEECSVVIGFGINIRLTDQMRKSIDQPVTCLADYSPSIDRNFLTAALLTKLSTALEEHMSKGFASFLERWQRFDALIGRNIAILSSSAHLVGTSVGVSERGALLLDVDNEITEIYSGEISVRPY